MLQEVTINGQEVECSSVDIDIDIDRDLKLSSMDSDEVIVTETRTKTVDIDTEDVSGLPSIMDGGVTVTVNGKEHELDAMYIQNTYMKAEEGDLQHYENLVGTKKTQETYVKDKSEEYGFL